MKRKEQSDLDALLEHRVKRILTAAAKHPEEVLSKQEGIDAECSYCDMEEKVCLQIPDYLCTRALKAGTLLDESERLAGSLANGKRIGLCELCGAEIDSEQIHRNPESSLCVGCTAAAIRTPSPAGKKGPRRR